MAAVTALRNLSLGVSDLDEAVRFFTETWGLEEVDRAGGAVYLRGTGPYHHILALRASESEEVISADFLTGTRADADAIHQRVVAAGVTSAEPAKITTPGGGYGFTFQDPDGRTVRVIAEDQRYAPVDGQPDRPSRIMHAVLNAPDKDATAAFYCKALGFTISNDVKVGTFLKCNEDHHALAFFRSNAPTLNHIAFKMQDAAAVSRGAERMLSRGYTMGWGLGRHTIEVYAYFEGPRRLPIEYITVVGLDWQPDTTLPHWDTHPERTPELDAAMSRIPFQTGALELAI